MPNKSQEKDKKENTSLAAKGALAHRLQRRTAFKIQNGRLEAPKWPTESAKVSTLRFLGILSNFRKISFLIRALLLWEKETAENGEKRLMRIVATTSLTVVDRPNTDR